ncbi:MAG: hypothetical protein HYZ26_14620 [Chloroflexi bacterium]|nr:hypothetical protein [Chloroflexota bacterium]
MRRSIESILALIGLVVCMLVAILFASVAGLQGAMFPFPGLYLIQIALLGVLGTAPLWLRAPAWHAARWAAAGMLLAFSILGAFTLGPFVLPACLSLLGAAFLSSREAGLPVPRGLAWFAGAALAQAALMLLFVQLSIRGMLL